ncbi:MAG: response regulator [Nitrospirae bacterium]|nr:response regulator [Nitrospirota bacterium]
MSISLKTKVSLFVSLIVVVISAVSTYLFISEHRHNMERELTARGTALIHSLARASEEGLAGSDLDLINKAAHVVKAADVELVQIYSPLWQSIDAFPVEKINEWPDREAMEHFKKSDERFFIKKQAQFDFYAPIIYRPAVSLPKATIGYARLTLSSSYIHQAMIKFLIGHIAIALFITFIAIIAISAVIQRLVINPVIKLHSAATAYKSGDLKKTVSIEAADEIGQLAEEFNKMSRAIDSREKELKSANAFVQSVLDGVAESVMVIDHDYRVIAMNRVAKEEHFGDGPIPERIFCFRISHHRDEPCRGEDHPCPLKEVLRTKKPVAVAHNHFKQDGTEATYDLLASPIFDEKGEVMYVIEINRDITDQIMKEKEQKKLEERLFVEQKDQSISTLAGGIAHDFNNLLMGVLGNAELLRIRLRPDRKEEVLIDNIVKSSDRMANLVRQLLAYAKGGKYELQVLSLNDLIRKVMNMTHTGKFRKADVALDLAEDLWPVYADPRQIDQTLVNLFTNAFEAMEEKGGRLTVRTANIKGKVSWECALKHSHPAGDYVYIGVSDTGHGIHSNIKEKIFDPFFTTKFMGRGLGLSAVAGIIQNHDGCVSVDSQEGKGTELHIFLPRAVERTSEAAAMTAQAENKGLKKTILIAEDEPQVGQLIIEVITDMGYEPVLSVNGLDAFEMFTQKKDTIQLVILDIQMPGMDGKQLFREIRAIAPDMKVLISSGYNEKTALEGITADGPDGFIQKPYRLEALKKKIEDILSV